MNRKSSSQQKYKDLKKSAADDRSAFSSATRFRFRIALVVMSTLLTLIAVEIVLRTFDPFDIEKNQFSQPLLGSPPDLVKAGLESGKAPPPLHIKTSTPVLYGLNPRHPLVSEQGLNNRIVENPKPKGRFRILVLGDSVAYGANLKREEAFPFLLEKHFRKLRPNVEVINAAVSGYTPYNEVQYYLTEGYKFEADVVIVAHCLNDIVNPRLHWNYTGRVITDIPNEAIPNKEYDEYYSIPFFEKKFQKNVDADLDSRPFWKSSALYKTIRAKLPRLLGESAVVMKPIDPQNKPPMKHPRPRRRMNGKWPTYITGEDDLSIEAYLDEGSPEFAWLEKMYDKLHEATEKNNAALYVVVLPLAYQLEQGYPFLPQNRIREYCIDRNIGFVDVLPSLKQHPEIQPYLHLNASSLDIWHFQPQGHALIAETLYNALSDDKAVSRSR